MSSTQEFHDCAIAAVDGIQKWIDKAERLTSSKYKKERAFNRRVNFINFVSNVLSRLENRTDASPWDLPLMKKALQAERVRQARQAREGNKT